MVISEPCAVPPVSIATLITAVTRTVSKAPLEVSRATAWRWFVLAYLSTQPSVVYLSVILTRGWLRR
jgi:hypothetical protein